jgi:hypothetical protein
MDDDTNCFSDAAFGFGPRRHAHLYSIADRKRIKAPRALLDGCALQRNESAAEIAPID